MKSLLENIWLSKDLFTSFPGAECLTLHPDFLLGGVLKVSSCSSTGLSLHRQRANSFSVDQSVAKALGKWQFVLDRRRKGISGAIKSSWASQVAVVVKNIPANGGGIRDTSLIPGSGRSPGGGHDNSLQYSCLKNPMDRGAWRATVHRITKSWIRLKQLNAKHYV